MGEFEIDPSGALSPVDEARALRVVLAIYQDDWQQLMAVSEETRSDPRGSVVAQWSLVVAMGGAVAAAWSTGVGVDVAVDGIRRELLRFEELKDA